ncbi:hypothetical protein E2C01_028355 [Portunus trituberculatus]|uniref:Uncharacterized protein n=1 Tax=Portunus trituberculatus TaxID=210409 RepID=A0A5B7EP41_PORTR|nr:hypothetical protein [Portunus trituberculatus]
MCCEEGRTTGTGGRWLAHLPAARLPVPIQLAVSHLTGTRHFSQCTGTHCHRFGLFLRLRLVPRRAIAVIPQPLRCFSATNLYPSHSPTGPHSPP